MRTQHKLQKTSCKIGIYADTKSIIAVSRPSVSGSIWNQYLVYLELALTQINWIFSIYLCWFLATRKELGEHLIGEIDRIRQTECGTSAG